MPSLIMKTKLSMGALREKSCLGVCQNSSIISKKPCSHVQFCQQAADCDMLIQKFQDGYVSSHARVCSSETERIEAINEQEFPDGRDPQFWKHTCLLADNGSMDGMDSTYNSVSSLETIFSPALEPIEFLSVPKIDEDAGSNKDSFISGLGADDSNGSSCSYQICNVSDFFVSDMIFASLPFDGSMIDDITEINPFPDYKCAEPSLWFDVAEELMALPFLGDTANPSNSSDIRPCEETVIDPDNASLYLAINQVRSCNQASELSTDSDQAEDFDPQLFIKNLPELSDVMSNFHPIVLHKESWRRKTVTLVLDLDETLVHSTLDHCDDADFTFNVFFNMKEHTVYVKQRPHLHAFLERVADMFEVVIFTASHSIYAEQLLDILDPGRKLISQRVYRESCIFFDGSYTKDLTVLGVDLAKVAIIDNSPQVFRLQVNNGIPIKSWFSDPSDCALLSLLPFLETLVDADDVRPIIAKRFGNKE